MKDFFAQGRPLAGLTYEAYLDAWRAEAAVPLDGLDPTARRYVHYKRYNLERAARVQESYEVSAKLRRLVEAVEAPQVWMVLTESWCPDSAFNLPPIAAAASLNSRIHLRILPRDANLDIMDQYLTGGTRGIPKLVAFTDEGEELFTWGPRPEGARALRERLQADGASKAELTSALLAWYEQGGWRAVDEELAEALEQVLQED